MYFISRIYYRKQSVTNLIMKGFVLSRTLTFKFLTLIEWSKNKQIEIRPFCYRYTLLDRTGVIFNTLGHSGLRWHEFSKVYSSWNIPRNNKPQLSSINIHKSSNSLAVRYQIYCRVIRVCLRFTASTW